MSWSRVIAVALFVLAGIVVGQPPPPTYIPQTRFSQGQDVVPTFEGWIKNPDGMFTLVFGYLNRNHEEELVIPAGNDNKLEPGAADQGQPTFFLTRRRPWNFRVKVPADFGNKELVWTLTANGKTNKAFGSLKSDEEITERIIMTRGNLSPGFDNPNQPPVVSIRRVDGAVANQWITLAADITDDGLPKPRVPKAPTAAADSKSQTNTVSNVRIGLSVAWSQYRGPAKATFEQAGPISAPGGGLALTRVRFLAPGTYVLRATGTDDAMSVTRDVTVLVAGHQP